MNEPSQAPAAPKLSPPFCAPRGSVMVTVTTRHLSALEHAERRMYPVRPGEEYADLAVMANLIKAVKAALGLPKS